MFFHRLTSAKSYFTTHDSVKKLLVLNKCLTVYYAYGHSVLGFLE